MTVRTHDYDTLEREFLADPKLSIRELCKRHEIKGYSTVAQYARENDWYKKRGRVQERTLDKLVEEVSEAIADEQARKIIALTEDWLTVTQASLYKWAEQLKDPSFIVRVEDLTKLLDKGLVLTGQPSERTEERHLALTGSIDGLPPEFLQRLAEATRPRKLVGGGEAEPPRSDPSGSRQN